MQVLILGGSEQGTGGVDSFCRRAIQAFRSTGIHSATHVCSNSSYMNWRRLSELLPPIRRILRFRRQGGRRIWIQYTNSVDLLFIVLSRCIGLKIAVTPHFGPGARFQSSPLLRFLHVVVLSFADRLLLLWEEQGNQIALPKRVSRYEIGTFLPRQIIGCARQKQKSHEDRLLRLIHVARLSEEKGTFAFLEVCRRLNAANTPFLATVIGGCDDATMLMILEQIATHQLSNRVSVLGQLDEDDVLRHLRESDVLVHLSRIDAFPLVVLEALGCGVFPVCKDIGGVKIITDRYCGITVDCATTENTVAMILSQGDVGHFRRLARHASKQIAEDFNWNAIISGVEGAFGASRAGA